MLPSTTKNDAPITKQPPRPETHKLHDSKRDKIWNPELAQTTRTNRGEKKPMRGEIGDRMGRIVGKAGRGGEASGATSLFLRVSDTCRAWMRACMGGWWAIHASWHHLPHVMYAHPYIHNIHVSSTDLVWTPS